MTASEASVTRWVRELKGGDEVAAQELWRRYFPRLVRLCREKLADHPRRAYDEEDVALSAFDSFCRGAEKGRFPLLRDRDNLWPLLVTIATRKASNHIQHERRKKRGAGQVQGESAIAGDPTSTRPWGVQQVIGTEPTPELAAVVVEEYERLMACLESTRLRTVAQLKMDGHTNKEIAKQLGCSPRTIARKLWVIRAIWSEKAPRHE